MADLALLGDLRDEQDALDAVLAGISEAEWDAPTPSPGWTVRDQIGHLTYFDGTAILAITAPDEFNASLDDLLNGDGKLDDATLHRHLPVVDLLDRWRSNRSTLIDAAATLDERDRVPWYGPSMGAKSFVTARLMETWAHGQDVVDALGVARPATDRIAHIVRLGFITRGWTYVNRGEEMPLDNIRLALTAPSGAVWYHGDDEAPNVVSGPALDFCLVVTQRRHVDDTSLDIAGDAARDWLVKAQAFAGPATDGPRPSNQSGQSPSDQPPSDQAKVPQ